MEGQDPKIRTMADDLELAKKEDTPKKETSPKPLVPKQRPRIEPPEIKPKAKFDSTETKKAEPRDRLDAMQAPQKITPPSPRRDEPDAETPHEEKEKTLSDILKQAKEKTIQEEDRPVYETQKEDLLPIEDTTSVSEPKIGEETKRPAGEGEPPSPKFQRGEPPRNLPTADMEEVLPKQAPPQQKKQGSASLPPKILPETPEKILGLPEKVEQTPPISEGVKAEEKIPERPTPPPKTKRKLSIPRFIVVVTLLSIVFVATVAGLYFMVFKAPSEDQKTPTPTTPIVEPQPAAFIKYEQTHTIDLEELAYETLKPELDALSGLEFPKNSITHIQIKYKTPKFINYLDIDELTNILGIVIPSELLNKDYNLFLYTPGEEEMTSCEDENITEASCYGPRLGLIIDIRENEAIIADTMLQWEETLPADLGPLILANYVQNIAEFNSSNYKGITVRFKNLLQEESEVALNTTSIDWLLTDTKLIIGTSMNAARSALDKIIIEP